MSYIIAIIVGGFVGWIASLLVGTDSQQGLILNIIIGVIGALLGRWIFGDLLGISSAETSGTLSVLGIIWGVIGAVILIVILRLLGVFR